MQTARFTHPFSCPQGISQLKFLVINTTLTMSLKPLFNSQSDRFLWPHAFDIISGLHNSLIVSLVGSMVPTLTCCTKGMTFFINFLTTSIVFSSPRITLLSGKLPLFCWISQTGEKTKKKVSEWELTIKQLLRKLLQNCVTQLQMIS